MHISDLVKNPALIFPCSREDFSGDFLKYLEMRNNQYFSLLKTINLTDDLSRSISNKLPECQQLIKVISSCVSEYYKGRITASYILLSTELQKLHLHLKALYSIPLKDVSTSRFFRIRIDNKDITERKDLFHIPAEHRQKVNTQRFSVPGLPCLYFGSSSYIAWSEMGRPDFSTVNISRFEAASSIRVLNFGYNSIVIQDFLNAALASKSNTHRKKLIDFITSWFIFWPLMNACSIKRKSPDSPFAPEYIIPQFLLQFVAEDKKEKIDGIRYISTKYDKYDDKINFSACWAFPAKDLKRTGHCRRLIKLFHVTEVLPWRIAFSSNLPHDPINSDKVGGKCCFINGVPVDYCTTNFGLIEGMLDLMPASKLTR